jgi:hypothetical protein
MRKDVTALLEKLDRGDFRYRQFADPIADLEPWPLFAALLADPRVIGRPERIAATAAAPAGVAFLADYSEGEGSPGRGAPIKGSLQSFLSGLSEDPVESR